MAPTVSQSDPMTTPPRTEFPYPDNQEVSRPDVDENSDATTLVSARSSRDVHQEHQSTHSQQSSTSSILPEVNVTMEGPSSQGEQTESLDQDHIPTIPTSKKVAWQDGKMDEVTTDSSDDEDEMPGIRELNLVRRVSTRRTDSFDVGNDQFRSKGRFSRTDGRLKISMKDTAKSGYLAKALDATIRQHSRAIHPALPAVEEKSAKYADLPPPKLNILIAIIGSRGDIQPFIKIAMILKKYGHRVRFATHPVFKEFVEHECGLEFFNLGGDPSELMAFMVKNPGLIPSLDTLKKGEIGRRRNQMLEMFEGFWRACVNATDDENDVSNLKLLDQRYPFIADAIIANPPSFAHYHCAERLGIPLHLMFTFPYSPTQAFPHPLANIKYSNIDTGYTNFMSYPLVDLMIWQGLGDLVNRFRSKTLGLEEISTLWAPGQVHRMKVPYTYLWSPGLIPKPEDWGPEIKIAGYVFLDLASSYKPPKDLIDFLDVGEAIYIGFGSISGIDDPEAFTNMIFEATKIAGVRALVSKGWGGVGGNNVPENIYMLDNIPHDWLFPRVTAVVHHGGAGTTAAGLRFGKPTLIVPFFGDQPFWAQMVAKSGAGASHPIPYKQLSAERLAEGIKECLRPEAKQKAQEIAKSIEKEGDGAQNAVDTFHQALPLTGENAMRCHIFPDRVAVWQLKRSKIKLSALAAVLLVDVKRLEWEDLDLLRQRDWTDFQGPGEPITGASGALISSLMETITGVSRIPSQTKKDFVAYGKNKDTRQYRHIGGSLTIPGQIVQEKVNQRLPKGARVQDLGRALPAVNLNGRPEPARRPSMAKSVTGFQPNKKKRQDITNDQDLHHGHSLPVTITKPAAQGVGHSAKALVNLPIDMGYALTRGFHNAPRLYGDDTVRISHGVRGFKSGITAARDELAYGIIDGIVGVLRLPCRDIARDGVIGAVTGISKGLGGLVLKPITGILGVPTYLSKGMQMEVKKLVHDTEKIDRFIRRARMVEGSLDVGDITLERETKSETEKPMGPGDARRIAVLRWEKIQSELATAAEEGKKRSTSLRPSVDTILHKS